MTDKEKLIKIKSLADKMYDATFNLTTDTSLLRKAMDEYRQFIINEYHKEEPVSEELKEAVEKAGFQAYPYNRAISDNDIEYDGNFCNRKPYMEGFEDGANWQKKQDQSTIELAEDHAMLAGMGEMKKEMMMGSTDVTVHVDAGGYPYIPQMELYDYDNDVPLAKEGDKYKVVLIKEE